MANFVIAITPRYSILVDDLQYIVQCTKDGKSKKGEPITTVKAIGYYGGIDGALQQIVKQCVLDELDGTTVTIQQYLDTYRETTERFKDYLYATLPRGTRKE